MVKSLRSVLIAALGLLLAWISPVRGQDAPYVDSAITKARFSEITADDMAILRDKKILFASRSFGLNLYGGLTSLARQDARYEFLSSYQRFDVFKAGGDISIIPADAFTQKHFVHFLASYWPHTKRMEEVDDLMRKAPHNFGGQVDAVIVFFHTALPENFEQYSQRMDAMRRDFPNVRFIYVTAGFMGPAKAKENENAHAWSEKVRERYKGKQPLYDLGRILSDDYRSGHAYAPEYSKDPANVHPNTDAGQTIMAKGFLLLLRDTFRWTPPADASATTGAGSTSQPTVEAIKPNHPDYVAVRAILDANGLDKKRVENVAVIENGRVVKLYLQEGGMTTVPDAIGQLSELRVLHLYGDRNLNLPLLKAISPAIGKCTKLQELLLTSNELTTLPPEIAQLTQLTSLSIADNRLKDLSPAVKAWAQKHDPKGLSQQAR